MARSAFQYGDYTLGGLHGEACAIWTDEAGRHRVRLGVPRQPEAEARTALIDWVKGRERVTQAVDGVTCEDIWQKYLALKIAEKKSDHSIAAMKCHWKALAPYFGALDPLSIDDELCMAYAEDRFELGRKAWTVWSELNRLATIMSYGKKKRMFRDEVTIWKPKQGEARDRWLTPEEAGRLLDACTEAHTKLFVILALGTGARRGAIFDLQWDRVDFDKGTINYNETTFDPMSKAHKKGRAVVPMSTGVRAALLEARSTSVSGYCVEYGGQPVTTIQRSFRGAVARAGLDPAEVTPHVLRHTAATWLNNGDEPMARISDVLGHRETRTTEKVYAKNDVEKLRGAVDHLDNVVRLRAVK